MLRSQDPLLSTGRREGVCGAGKSSSGNGSVLPALSIMLRPGTLTTGTSFTGCPSSKIIPIRNYRGKAPQPFPREVGFFSWGTFKEIPNPLSQRGKATTELQGFPFPARAGLLFLRAAIPPGRNRPRMMRISAPFFLLLSAGSVHSNSLPLPR